MPRSTVRSAGQVLRISGEGMPIHNFPSERGDLDVIIEVDFPRTLSASSVQAIAGVM